MIFIQYIKFIHSNSAYYITCTYKTLKQTKNSFQIIFRTDIHVMNQHYNACKRNQKLFLPLNIYTYSVKSALREPQGT